MSSYIFSFRAPLAALALIGAVELAYSAFSNPSPVDRAGYLNFNFNTPELFHKALINEKLKNALRESPDVIQVGDSSGFHAIVPRTVEEYLPRMKYQNISCCANTGFDGYYTITEFMLRNRPSIKAVVLYMSIFNTPWGPLDNGAEVVGGAGRLQNAFGWLAPFTLPATLAARPDVLRSVYALGNAVAQPGLASADGTWPDMVESVRTNGGWWAEHDARKAAKERDRWWSSTCGPTGVIDTGNVRLLHTRDVFAVRQSYLKVELRRLASLAARHQAKLVVLFQPSPCTAIVGNYIPSHQADIAEVASEYPNVSLPDPAIFEAWPRQWFISAGHLRTGHEDAASRRAGRFIAKALGLPVTESEMPMGPPRPERPVLAWSSTDFTVPPWRPENVTLAPEEGDGGTAVFGTPNTWEHAIEAPLPQLQARTHIVSIIFRPERVREIKLVVRGLKSREALGTVRCMTSEGMALHSGAMRDSGFEDLPDGKFQCWGKLTLGASGAAVGATFVDSSGGGSQRSVVIFEASAFALEE